MNGDRRPVARPRVFAATVGIVCFVALLIVSVELLRHPLPEGFDPEVGLSAEGGDPREDIECGEEIPREGQARDAPAPGDAVEVERDQLAPVEVTSNELYDCPQTYDGRAVHYRGEVVGAVLRRDDGAWLHLNDDIYAEVLGPLPAHRDFRGGNAGIGVFVSPEVADRVDWVGGPDTQGDVLEVRGTFQRVDPATAEVAVIRADQAEIVRRGSTFQQEPLPDRRRVALVAAAIAAVVTVIERLIARRR